jgi:hypothetical protein
MLGDSLPTIDGPLLCVELLTNFICRDWRKADLSTDVIAFAAPTVEQVNLYWSGNQTVLRGWSCPEGIPRLHATTKQRLRTVIVHAAPVCLSTTTQEKPLMVRYRD